VARMRRRARSHVRILSFPDIPYIGLLVCGLNPTEVGPG
jgi:hypothetical protein